MFERATRECRTSPTIQMFSAVERAEALAQRVDVEQRLRRVLVLAVAGVDDARASSSRRPARRRRRAACGSRSGRAGRRDSVWTVSLSDSPFSTLEPLEAKLMTSARERLGGQLEGAARARGRLVEEVQHAPAAQRGDLLDLALGDLGERLRAVEDALDRRRGRGPRSTAGASSASASSSAVMVTSSAPSTSRDADVDALGARGRQVLADVVGADRQLAVAAVGQHGELHARGAPVVEQRLDRRRARCGRCRARRRRGRRCSPRAGSSGWWRGRPGRPRACDRSSR